MERYRNEGYHISCERISISKWLYTRDRSDQRSRQKRKTPYQLRLHTHGTPLIHDQKVAAFYFTADGRTQLPAFRVQLNSINATVSDKGIQPLTHLVSHVTEDCQITLVQAYWTFGSPVACSRTR